MLAADSRALAGTFPLTLARASSHQVVPFGKFEDKDGWAGRTLSGQYIGTIIALDYLDRRQSLYAELQSVDGKIYKMDHTFKVASKVVLDGERLAKCSHTIMNEYNEVCVLLRCVGITCVSS
jgi:hypothetical protein